MLRHGRIVPVLWVIAAAVAVAFVLGANDLWAKKSTMPAVTVYIKRVDAVQQQMRLPLTQLLTVYRGFSSRSNDAVQMSQLARAVSTLRTLERRFAALPAPPEAATLRTLVARFVQAEDAVAVEIEDLARFMPRFHAVTTRAGIANKQLGVALAAVKQPKPHLVRGTPKKIAAARAAFAAAADRAAAAQADAVDAYDNTLTRLLAGLRELRPPAVMGPAYRAQLRSLAATRTAGHALARELRKVKRSGVAVLGRRFTEASRLARSVPAQEAEIAAIASYNARVRALGTEQTRIRSELSTLQQQLH